MQRKEIHLYDTLISPKKILHKKSEWGKNDSCEYFFLSSKENQFILDQYCFLHQAMRNKDKEGKPSTRRLPDRYPTSRFILALDLMKEFSSLDILFASACRLSYK